MALRHIQSFARWTTGNTAAALTSGDIVVRDDISPSLTISATGGRDNGPSCQINTSAFQSNYSYVVFPLPAGVSTAFCGFWSKCGLRSTPYQWVQFNCNDVTQVYFGLDSSGYIQAYRGDATLLGTAATNPISSGVACYVEFYVTVSDTVGVAKARVNGVTVLELTGIDTQNDSASTIQRVLIANNSYNAGSSQYMCDIYVGDTLAGEVTGLLGPQQVYNVAFTADGAHTAWTPSTGGDRYSLIADTAPNQTDYITGTAGQKYTCKTCTISGSPSVINGVKLTYLTTGPFTGANALKPLMRKGGVDYEATALFPRYGGKMTGVIEVDPATLTKFTQSDLQSNIEFGLSIAS